MNERYRTEAHANGSDDAEERTIEHALQDALEMRKRPTHDAFPPKLRGGLDPQEMAPLYTSFPKE